MDTDQKTLITPSQEAPCDNWIAEGERLHQARQYKESLKYFQKAVEAEPQNPLAWHLHAQALVMCLKYQDAVVSCSKALELDSRNAATWFLKSFAHGALNEYPEALESCTRGLEIDPNNSMVWCTRGQYLYALGRLEEALESFGAALKMSPDNAYCITVTEKIKKWLKRDGRDIEAANRVIAFLQQGGYQEALTSYSESLKLDPRSITKSFNKDYALAHLENPEKMLKDLEKTRTQDQPKISLDLSQKEFEFGREVWIEVTLKNSGNTPARDITFHFPPEVSIKQLDIAPEMLQQLKIGAKSVDLDAVPELLPGNQAKKLVSLTANHLGQVSLDTAFNLRTCGEPNKTGRPFAGSVFSSQTNSCPLSPAISCSGG
jgi:tetratricopeptide (TPR) repeat protein